MKNSINSIQYGYTETSSLQVIGPKFLRITDIQNDKVDWSAVPYCKITEKEFEKYKLEDNDIVVARTGATTGKSYLIDKPPVSVFASYLIRLRCNDIMFPRFLWEFMKSPVYWKQITVVKKGSAQPGANAQILGNLSVPLPPLQEQKRITEKVEGLLGKIEEAKQLIEEAKETFELRRAAILEKAFSGELLTSSFNKITKKINEQITLEIPNHWEVKTLSDVVENYNNQRIPVSQKKREEMEGDIPYYGATGIVDFVDGYTHEGEFVCIGEDGANLLSRSKPQAFVIRGKSWVNNHAHVVKMNDNMCNNYLMHYINFIPLNDYVTGTAQPKLNRKNLDKIPIVLPPVNEQFSISQKIEDLLSKEIEMMNVCDSNLHGIDIIKQSIMNKAFRGELGTNDPSEENTIELLKEVLQEQVK
nr:MULTISPECIES: restriction endonuclease subunit S [Bacillus]